MLDSQMLSMKWGITELKLRAIGKTRLVKLFPAALIKELSYKFHEE